MYILAFSLIEIMDEVMCFQYAEDSSLCFLANRKDYGRHVDLSLTPLGEAMESFSHQAAQIGLQVHPAKTEVVVINGKDRAVPEMSLTFGGTTIKPSNKIRLLGFQVNSEFNIKDFIKPKLNEARRRVWMIKKLQTFTRSKEVLKLAYQVYVRSVLETFLPVTYLPIYGQMNDEAR